MGNKKKRGGLEPELKEAATGENHESQNELSLANGDSFSYDNKKKKKRKRDQLNDGAPIEVPTVSVAVPGSIIDNTQSLELATRVPLSLSPPSLFLLFSLIYIFILYFTSFFLVTNHKAVVILYCVFYQLAGQIARAVTIFRIDEVSDYICVMIFLKII